jgi:flagellar biosynthesis protein FliQ
VLKSNLTITIPAIIIALASGIKVAIIIALASGIKVAIISPWLQA